MFSGIGLCRLSRSIVINAHRELSKVTVIGSGFMGSGIAQVSAQAGYDVTIVDVSDDLLSKAREGVKKSLGKVATKKFKDNMQEAPLFVDQVMGRISLTTKAADAVGSCDLVVEAISENMDAKTRLFSELNQAAPSACLFATNTSSLRVDRLAESSGRPDRFGGLHFFSPVVMMRLVEVVKAAQTSDATFEAFYEFTKSIGKTPVKCKDTPGFVVNRLLVPYMLEAVRMLERGDASAADIDTAMKLGAGYPMGPFQLSDFVGLDVLQSITAGWHKDFPDNPLFNPCPVMDKLVAEGKFGRKTGEGFFKYDK